MYITLESSHYYYYECVKFRDIYWASDQIVLTRMVVADFV